MIGSEPAAEDNPLERPWATTERDDWLDGATPPATSSRRGRGMCSMRTTGICGSRRTCPTTSATPEGSSSAASRRPTSISSRCSPCDREPTLCAGRPWLAGHDQHASRLLRTDRRPDVHHRQPPREAARTHALRRDACSCRPMSSPCSRPRRCARSRRIDHSATHEISATSPAFVVAIRQTRRLLDDGSPSGRLLSTMPTSSATLTPACGTVRPSTNDSGIPSRIESNTMPAGARPPGHLVRVWSRTCRPWTSAVIAVIGARRAVVVEHDGHPGKEIDLHFIIGDSCGDQ